MIKCKNCRHSNIDDAVICSHCSMPLFESRVVPSSGSKNILELKTGKTILIKGGETIIGRAGSVSIPNDKYISKSHAKIVVKNNVCTIYDLKSKNGTMVNNKKLSESYILSSGDKIQCGRTVFIFRKN